MHVTTEEIYGRKHLLGALHPMTYIVGGFCRDKHIGLMPNDMDIVVEATEEQLREAFPAWPRVGKDFPVFMSDFKSEIALTRTERSTGDGYGDFVVDRVGVPLIEDLGRRDFTVNSIAWHMQTETFVDPFGGIPDCKAGILRTVFEKAFLEDPVRILRGARLHARLGFTFDDNTLSLMKAAAHKLQFVTKERIVLELEKLWKAQNKFPASSFFKVLAEIDALKYIIKPLDDLRYVTAGPIQWHHGNTAFEHTMEVIDRCQENEYSFSCFIACMCHDFGKATTKPEILPHHYGHELRSKDIAEEWLKDQTFDRHTNKLVLTVARYHMQMHYIAEMKGRKVMALVKAIRSEQWPEYHACCMCDHPLTSEQDHRWRMATAVAKHAVIDVTNAKNPREAAFNQYVQAFAHAEKDFKSRLVAVIS